MKRARLLADESDGDYEMEDDLLAGQSNDCSFEELCDEAAFIEDIGTGSETENESWGMLNGHVLARVFHFLRADMKSLMSSAATCKRWNVVVKFYKNLCRHVDLSNTSPRCTDSMFQSIMVCFQVSFIFAVVLLFIAFTHYFQLVLQGGYNKKNVASLVLAGCTNISASVLEEVLHLFPCICYIDVRGCNQFNDLKPKFQNVKWIKSFSLSNLKNYEESHSKIRSLKQITEKSYSMSKTLRGLGGQLDDSDELGNFDYSESSLVDRKDSSSLPFRQGFYKRAKVLDARKSRAVLSRDAQMRRWLQRKSESGYRKMEEFIANSLKDIMKGNKFEFFIPKVLATVP